MELPEVEDVLDVLAGNHSNGWELHKIDSVHIFIRNSNFKGGPHVRIRRDNGDLDCLGGITFRYGVENVIGRSMPCGDFVKLVKNSS